MESIVADIWSPHHVLWVSLTLLTTSKSLLGQAFQAHHLFCAETLTDTSIVTFK